MIRMSLARQRITALANLEEVILDSNFELNLDSSFGTVTSLVELTKLKKSQHHRRKHAR